MDSEPPSSLNTLFLFSSYEVTSVLIVLFLVIFSAIISGSEVAFFSLNKKSLEDLKQGNPIISDKFALLLNNKKKLLSTILILINSINIGIVLILSKLLEGIPFNSIEFLGFYISEENLRLLFDLVFITFIILVFAEILPKIYAKFNPIQMATLSYPFLYVSQIIFKPISAFLLFLSELIDKFLKNNSSLTIDELSQALELASEDKNTTKEDQKILEGIVNFGNTIAKQVMTPRVDMFAVKKKTNFPMLLKLVQENGYSRIPVFNENIDDVVGIIYAKDLISHLEKTNYNWHLLIREAYFVPENKKLDDLLMDFQEKKKHMAIVVDEYGGTSGIVSLEDVIEEIVGDISDEFDDEEVSFTKIDDSIFSIDGKTALKDFYRIINADEKDFEDKIGDADTLAGFLIENSENYPKKNQIIKYKNYSFQIEALDRRRLKMIKVTIHDSEDSDE